MLHIIRKLKRCICKCTLKNNQVQQFVNFFILSESHTHVCDLPRPTSTILEWNKLDLTLHKSSYKIFRNSLLKMVHPSWNPVYDIHNPISFCFLTRLRMRLSHLIEQKFNHNYKNCINPFCIYLVLKNRVNITFFPWCIQ